MSYKYTTFFIGDVHIGMMIKMVSIHKNIEKDTKFLFDSKVTKYKDAVEQRKMSVETFEI